MSAIISPCGAYRYRLEREVADEGKVFAYFGVNPSTADASLDDATVRKWRGFTLRNSGRRFIVGNVFSYRATDVRELANDHVDCDQTHWGHIKQIIDDADILVPCWGNRSKLPPGKVKRPEVLLAMLSANLYVNARNGLQGADITSRRWVGKTVKGAESWAAKQLAA